MIHDFLLAVKKKKKKKIERVTSGLKSETNRNDFRRPECSRPFVNSRVRKIKKKKKQKTKKEKKTKQ